MGTNDLSQLLEANDAQAAARRAAEARTRRKVLLVASIGFSVVVTLSCVWYFVLHDRSNPCTRLVGPVAELEQLARQPLELGAGFKLRGQCTQSVERTGRVTSFAVQVTSGPENLEGMRKREGARPYAKQTTVQTALGEALLFVAGDRPEPADAALLADAQQRVGTSRDPLGDALSKLPPEQHLAIMHSDTAVITVMMDRHLFTEDQLRAYATAVAARVR